MKKYPHVIENGAGEQLTFLRLVSDPSGERLEGHNLVQPGAGAPMHIHHMQEETFTVQQGKLGYQLLDQEPQYATVGETVVFAPGQAHRFWNAGEEELSCTAYVKPADNVEYLLTALFDSQKQNGGKRPDIFDAAYLMKRYSSEYKMVEIPDFVQRFIFPVLVTIGRLLRKYEKYADAPEPIRR